MPCAVCSCITRTWRRRPEDEIAALAWFDAELGNLLACAYYANDKAMLPFAWQLPSAMTSFLRLRGFLAQAVSVLDTALRTLIAEPDTTGATAATSGASCRSSSPWDGPPSTSDRWDSATL